METLQRLPRGALRKKIGSRTRRAQRSTKSEVRGIDQILLALPDPAHIVSLGPANYRELLDSFTARLRSASLTNSALRELCGVGAMHPDPWVRFSILRHLANQAPQDPRVRRLVTWLIHDSEDFIAFEAIRAAGRTGLREALRELLVIIGRASERISRGGKPVGVGHALVLKAVTEIVGTSDSMALAKVESQLFKSVNRSQPIFRAPVPQTRRPAVRRSRRHVHENMIHVPPGSVTIGIPPVLEKTALLFEWTDVEHPELVWTDGVWMDKDKVTVAQYDEFARSGAARKHLYCHPSEPPNKLHVRNTLYDARFEASHPVTGVDWFDAYAYAAWVGKRLPSEVEWQHAAQGEDMRAFPWGNKFDPARARWIAQVSGRAPAGLEEWRQDLVTISGNDAVPLTAAVDIVGSESPFGLRGMSGNAWEWTGTNFYTCDEMSPEIGERDSLETITDRRSYPVIRGGSWSSIPELISVAFRGKDLMTDRHNENGFRCVCNCRGA